MTASRSLSAATFALLSTLVIGWGLVSNFQCAAAIDQEFLSFNFFYHDNLIQATDNSAYLIVPPLQTPTFARNDSLFGGVAVFDDSLTAGPDRSSLEIGRGRGIYVYVFNSTLGPGIEFLWTAEFNEASGYGEGSTLTFKGFDRYAQPVREIAIVGGTGKFRLARGWAELVTYSKLGNALDSITLNVTASVYYGLG